MIKTSYIAKMVNGKPQIFATTQKDNGAPVYIFTEKETFDAAIEDHLIPVGALIVKTYDAIEMAGGPFDAELSTESENAPQNKAVANALSVKASQTEYGMSKICPVDVTDVTEDNGLVLGGKEKNPSVEGTLANKVESTNNTLKSCYFLQNGTPIIENSDLNSYINIGNYHCHDAGTVRSLTNCPVSEPFIMKVEFALGIGWPCQIIRKYSDGSVFYRFTNNNESWYPWYVLRSEKVT